jgi:uncharacterized protein
MRRTSRSISWTATLLFAIGALGAVTRLANRFAKPELVDDAANLMSATERGRLAEYHAYLARDHDIDYRVVTVVGVEDINAFATKRFERLADDTRSRRGRGLLLVIDPQRDLVRLEVSYALEGTYPDAFVAYVEHRQMVPFFARNRVADGILAATELIVARAQRAAANAGFEGEVWSSASGGAGATAPARLGAGPEPAMPPSGERAPAGSTPEQTLAAYFAALGARNASPGLGIYTPETQVMLRGWVTTPAQMDNVVKTYAGCHPEPARFAANRDLAVIRYPIRERVCAPWFFRRVDDAWALDLTMMQSSIRFGRTNAWHFAPDAEHPYRFAFEDWRFDREGFPAGR